MKSLAIWDPFRELDEFSNRLSSAFNRSLEDGSKRSTLAAWAPSVDIIENKKEYLISAELQEVKKDDVKVAVENGVLTITGQRKYEHEEKDAKALRVERFYGNFSRSFEVPDDADAEKITADFKNGILKVRLPKSEKAQPKQIDIKVS